MAIDMLERLLRSVRKFYPTIAVVVADNSFALDEWTSRDFCRLRELCCRYRGMRPPAPQRRLRGSRANRKRLAGQQLIALGWQANGTAEEFGETPAHYELNQPMLDSRSWPAAERDLLLSHLKTPWVLKTHG